MQQDTKCFRDYNINDFVNTEWIYAQLDKQNNNCSICFAPLEVFLNENNIVKSNITIDRNDNKISHIKTNCQLLCNMCNCSKKHI